MTAKHNPIPESYRRVTPCLVVLGRAGSNPRPTDYERPLPVCTPVDQQFLWRRGADDWNPRAMEGTISHHE